MNNIFDSFFAHNGVVAKAQPRTRMPNRTTTAEDYANRL